MRIPAQSEAVTRTTRLGLHRCPNPGIGPASTFCSVCRFLGCGCKVTCRDCGPFGWFTCCDRECVNGPGDSFAGSLGVGSEVYI